MIVTGKPNTPIRLITSKVHNPDRFALNNYKIDFRRESHALRDALAGEMPRGHPDFFTIYYIVCAGRGFGWVARGQNPHNRSTSLAKNPKALWVQKTVYAKMDTARLIYCRAPLFCSEGVLHYRSRGDCEFQIFNGAFEADVSRSRLCLRVG